MDLDAERFFRAVDRAVLEHHSRPSGLPLILAALPEHHSLFRPLSENSFLVSEQWIFILMHYRVRRSESPPGGSSSPNILRGLLGWSTNSAKHSRTDSALTTPHS